VTVKAFIKLQNISISNKRCFEFFLQNPKKKMYHGFNQNMKQHNIQHV